jgi:hypothetical protein
MMLIPQEETLSLAAAKAGMDEKTARKYRSLGHLPSEVAGAHTWRTRHDPFGCVWEEVEGYLTLNPGLQAKTLFAHLQRCYPGQFSDGQLRSLQRHVRLWRAIKGPAQEVFFAQVHHPGQLSQSDFTCMNTLGVTLGGCPFDHLIYHFVLTYSNWESGSICFSESFESFSAGLQGALWELGGVPVAHQTDRLSAALHKVGHPERFTAAYRALLSHYGLEGRAIGAACPNQNGDVEQRHYRFKQALDQQLMLRGSRAFDTRKEYEGFLRALFVQLNKGRQDRFAEELALLRPLPAKSLLACKPFCVKVGPGSTIRILHNTYSVPSRLIRHQVQVRVFAQHLEVWLGTTCVARLPRLRGENRHLIQYPHIIDWLVRKPGAFENYRYRADLFPTSRFRQAYDSLHQRHSPQKADKAYLHLLHLAAKEGQTSVENALILLLDSQCPIDAQAVEALVGQHCGTPPVVQVSVCQVDLHCYDALLKGREVAA